MTLKLSKGAAMRISQAQAEGRKSAPGNMADHAEIAAAVGAAIREVLAAVDAEMAEHLGLIEDLQDRLKHMEKNSD